MAARRAYPGLDVRVAGDGREGIAYLEGQPPFQDRISHPYPSLVILDLFMPEIDGFGVLEWIRERGDPRRLPVVVLTSSSQPEHEARARALGAVAVHTKPEHLTELAELVKRIVGTWMRPASGGAGQRRATG